MAACPTTRRGGTSACLPRRSSPACRRSPRGAPSMRPETRAELVRRLRHYLDTGTTAMAEAMFPNPVSAYTSEERLALEKRVLFRAYPLLVGLSCRVGASRAAPPGAPVPAAAPGSREVRTPLGATATGRARGYARHRRPPGRARPRASELRLRALAPLRDPDAPAAHQLEDGGRHLPRGVSPGRAPPGERRADLRRQPLRLRRLRPAPPHDRRPPLVRRARRPGRGRAGLPAPHDRALHALPQRRLRPSGGPRGAVAHVPRSHARRLRGPPLP